MKAYTFDLKLNAAVTINAKSGADALRQLRAIFECADCNGGAFENGDPVLFEASLDQRPDIGMIDGESVKVSTANDWNELNASEGEPPLI